MKNFLKASHPPYIYKVCYPLAFLYGLGVRLRNLLFDKGILRSRTYPLPVICIGNLAVGGTGKTPHTEYLVRLLRQKRLQVGVLSRGYKRRSKGFMWGTPNSTMEQIGDEPFQMKSKFPDIRLAVDADRCHGIEQMMRPEVVPPIEAVLLDDAYQHRYVRAGLYLLLTDYRRPIYNDALLPAGRLREPIEGKGRAQAIVVTKCPPTLSTAEADHIRRCLHPAPHQQIFFSTLHYGKLVPLSGYPAQQEGVRTLDDLRHCQRLFLLTGIACPDKLEQDLATYVNRIEALSFPDHHAFDSHDVARIQRVFREAGPDSPVVTTEKDATRLLHLPLDGHIRQHIYVLPVEVGFLFGQQETFNQLIINYVETHPRNSFLPGWTGGKQAANSHHPGNRTGQPCR